MWADDAEDEEAILSTEATYTPTVDDDRKCLRVTAKYTDRTYNDAVENAAVNPNLRVRFANEAVVVSGVVRVNADNTVPVVTSPQERYVPENTPGDKYVGEACGG